MKKLFSFWIVVAMLVTVVVPHGIVKADTQSDLDTAKEYIDAIVKVAPTVDEYSFSENLAEQVDGLERVLRYITSGADMEKLDAYVAEKTTVVTNPETGDKRTYFTSAYEFSVAYVDKQKNVLKNMAVPISNAIQKMLGEPLQKKNYDTAQEAYNAVSKHVRDSVDGDDVNALNQIHELFTLMSRADTAFSHIKIPTKNSSLDDYEFFMKDFETAKTAYGLYDSKYASLKPKYYICLQKDSKNALLQNYSTYAKAMFHVAVEKAYDDLGVYTTFQSAIKEKMQILSEAVEAGQKSEYKISVYDYYRGEKINYVLNQYNHLSELEGMMVMVPETPTNKTELTAALRAYRYYSSELSTEEKGLVPKEYVTKINNAVLLNTTIDDVMKAINDIGIAKSDSEYEKCLERYNKAYKAYRLLINNYSGVSGIESLVTNVAVLDNATEIIEMINTIHEICSTQDALMCSKKLQMESVLDGYSRMSTEKQIAVYNIDSLRTVYKDAEKASDLRTKIDVIANNHSLIDQEYVNSIHDDYQKLSETAKKYLGDDYVSKIQNIDRDLEVLNVNKALRVTALIAQIGEVNVNSKALIVSARTAYEQLTEQQKTYVTNYSLLTQAEESLSKLEDSIEKATISDLGDFYYTGKELTPTVTVELNGRILVENMDYRLVYESNVQIGTAKMMVQGIGNYTGYVVKKFSIRACPIAGIQISGYAGNYTYTGKNICPGVKATLNGKNLVQGKDYKITFKNNKNCGMATVTITGMGAFYGNAQVFFNIVRRSVKKALIGGVKKAYVKTGKAIKPKATVVVDGVTLKKKRDYKISYSKNVKRGKATLTVKGIGNYTGTKKVTYKIV